MKKWFRKNSMNLFYLPALIIMLTFLVFPLANGFRLSFLKWNGYSPKTSFVGIQNYLSMLTDNNLGTAFRNTLLYGFGSTILQNILGLSAALFVNSRFKGHTAVRTFVYLPIMISSLVMGYIIYYFVQNGFTLGLNIVNMIFLFLGLLLHGDLRRYVDAIGEAAAGASGILLQFPFYAGIMGMMVAANDQGVSLAGVISEFFVSVSNNVTFPMLSFLAAGVVNFFVPSGGGQWAVQGPIMMPAGAAMGIENGRTAMAIAWGDQWTNMIQPFWALPALGVAKLSARDIMGYLVVVLLFTGVVACLGFLAWAAWF